MIVISDKKPAIELDLKRGNINQLQKSGFINAVFGLPKSTTSSNFILREDGFYILREDGFKIIRES